MSSLALAQELVDRIVDFLHDDPVNLSACALTHSHFRAPSQYHIFDRVILKDSVSAASLGGDFRRTPALALYVRELCLFNCDLLSVHMALGPLPRLRTLRTQSAFVLFRWLHTSDMRGFASATRLVLDSTLQFADMAQLAALVRAFPALNALQFMGAVSVKEPGLRGVDPPPPGLRLVHLSLSGIADEKLLAALTTWLCGFGSKLLAGLDSLDINALHPPPASLLQSVASSLKYLHVALAHDDRYSTYPC
jgi:hypothetical protein